MVTRRGHTNRLMNTRTAARTVPTGRSIISYQDVILEGADIRDSIILPSVTIGKNAKIKNAIVNEGLRVKDGTVLKFDKPTLVDTNYEGVEVNE